MTVKERMMSVYNNRLPDKAPVAVYGFFLPRGFSERNARNLGLGIIDFFPLTSSLGPPMNITDGFIPKIKGAEFSVGYFWDKGKLLEKRTFETPVGNVWHISEKSVGASRHVIKYYVTEPEDYKIIQYLVENTEFISNEPAVKRKLEDLGDDGVVLGRLERTPYQKLMIEIAGTLQFLMDVSTEPEIVGELIDTMNYKMTEHFGLCAQTAADGYWSPDNVTALLTPPSYFDKYNAPLYREFSKIAKQAGKPYLIHMDGCLKPLQSSINTAGFDVIESMSYPQIGGDMTLAEAVEAFPGKVVAPNFPANLCYKSDDDIREFIDGKIEETRGKIPFMFAVSEDLPEAHFSRVLQLLCQYAAEKA